MKVSKSRIIASIVLVCMLAVVVTAQNQTYTNSLGMRMIRIRPGSFNMGSATQVGRDYWDEQPAHRVTISKAFYMAETEVTVEQFRQFQADFMGTEEYRPYAAGVSWFEAQAFCKWLSEQEDKPYRLPTEAEWEYACRAGTTTLYSSGDTPPEPETPNRWGLKNMHTGVREWCFDLHGEYPAEHLIDPVGPEKGMVRVVRGGSLDNGSRDADRKIWNASASRCGMAPNFGVAPSVRAGKVPNKSGYHNIGFRVVQAPMPTTPALLYEAPFVQQCVKQSTAGVTQGPDPDKPYFRKRFLIATPPDNGTGEEIDALALHPALRGHNHSPGLEVCPNGDVLMVTYTSYHEYEPGVSMMATRLRYGADQWDMPERIFDFVGANDHCAMLWNDGGTVVFFWGNPKLDNAYPFQWMTSQDNGATWSSVSYPDFVNEIGCHSRQPINTVFRDKKGTIYVSSDGCGGKSVLWVGSADGRLWRDTGGRSHGRHTSYALLADGRILGLGGKNTDINGWMPKSLSSDGGKTWKKEITPFPAQGSNQRPTLIRLKSGRLFFCADFQHIGGHQPEGVTKKGSYAALSESEGETWFIKKLIGTQPHENPRRHNGADTIGYSVARQAPNGVIHLMTTMNRPCLHLAMNEAWILDTETKEVADEELMKSTASEISNVRQYNENYDLITKRCAWSAGTGKDGRYLLEGTQTCYYKDGQKQWQAGYKLGRKVGRETYWSPDGGIKWTWNHDSDGSSVWTQYWPNGQKKAESTWRNLKADGTATLWDSYGKIISQRLFVDGKLLEKTE